MRRLPVYLMLDVSGSMSGEPIEALRDGLSGLVSELRGDPYALETVYLSVITFDSTAKQVVPLTELPAFQEPELRAGGATSMGDALNLLAKKIDSEVTKTTHEVKGDWKPMVFLMTDGNPTDDWRKGVDAIKKKKCTIVACAAGYDADLNILKQITEIVVQLKSTTVDDLKAFFKWMTASIQQGSQKVDAGGSAPSGISELPPPPAEIMVTA